MKDLQQPSAVFQPIVRREKLHTQSSNEKNETHSSNSSQDIIFPFPEGVITDHLILRGDYQSLTLCCYGQALPRETQHHLPFYKKNIELSLLKHDLEMFAYNSR
jgi:hypothetical protein